MVDDWGGRMNQDMPRGNTTLGPTRRPEGSVSARVDPEPPRISLIRRLGVWPMSPGFALVTFAFFFVLYPIAAFVSGQIPSAWPIATGSYLAILVSPLVLAGLLFKSDQTLAGIGFLLLEFAVLGGGEILRR